MAAYVLLADLTNRLEVFILDLALPICSSFVEVANGITTRV